MRLKGAEGSRRRLLARRDGPEEEEASGRGSEVWAGSRVDRARSSGLTSPVGGRALDAPLLSTDREGLAREACREQVEGRLLDGI